MGRECSWESCNSGSPEKAQSLYSDPSIPFQSEPGPWMGSRSPGRSGVATQLGRCRDVFSREEVYTNSCTTRSLWAKDYSKLCGLDHKDIFEILLSSRSLKIGRFHTKFWLSGFFWKTGKMWQGVSASLWETVSRKAGFYPKELCSSPQSPAAAGCKA